MRKYTDVLWDFDGTLYDSYEAINAAVEGALRFYSISYDRREVLEQIRIGALLPLRRCSEKSGVDYAALRDKYRELVYAEIFDSTVLFPGIADLLRETRALGIRHHVCSHRNYASCVAYFKRDGILDLFTGYAVPELGLPGKPHPDYFEYLYKTQKIDARSCLMVGDRPIDVEGAVAAGCDSVFFEPERYGKYDPPYTYHVYEPEDLKKIILTEI